MKEMRERNFLMKLAFGSFLLLLLLQFLKRIQLFSGCFLVLIPKVSRAL